MKPAGTPLAASRRTLLRLGPAALLWALAARRALAEPVHAALVPGLHAMNALAQRLRDGTLLPTAWQDEMARLVAGLDVAEAVRALDLERLAATFELPHDRPLVRELSFPDLDHALRDAGLRPRLFALAPGCAIVPHGHHGMVSMHWLLHGSVHGRHFDRLEQSRSHVLMRPSLDRMLRPGDATSISDDRDNIHWFVAMEPAFTLDVIVSHLHDEGPHGRFYVDPRAAEAVGQGELRAPIIGAAEARRRYGRG